ncbi:PREDICTED: PQ-loop repeat-containing protein 1 isoform X1 [Nicrophorus vespilloides]|uniref:PQ-loop repeat-containing protein 1 isoform X1 n=1 Tax=Nicrophorus vespilloides TaxID=110193 RepID=A0ABM1N5N5_NICVS|nr:PREDICTED: PQ-loop repeat-containing protein 1 isoform X1 [Nicrophorus vespilloides]
MDWVISDELSLTVGHLVGWVSAGAMIIGGVIPYIPQYKQIKQTQDAEGFSLLVCLALLIANTLRIMFWFGKHFEYPLLIQSFIMNITMFTMIHLCVRVRNKNQIMQARQRIFTARPSEVVRLLQAKPPCCVHSIYDFDSKFFWNWTDFQSYMDCMLVFTIVSSFLMYLLMDYVIFVETVGFLAVFTEAMLGAPQLVKNFKNKSTEGMSITMVALWTFGDIFKTAYFFIREAPLQFWICGCLQVSIDLLILLQVYIYRCNEEPKRSRSRRGD